MIKARLPFDLVLLELESDLYNDGDLINLMFDCSIGSLFEMLI